MFEPPRCPRPGCPYFNQPPPDFYRRKGSFKAKCRSHPVPRYVCKCCLLSFSRQTFRADYRDHKPYLNARVIQELASGVGFRQTARIVGLTRRNLEQKARKLFRHARLLDLNLKKCASHRERLAAEAHQEASETASGSAGGVEPITASDHQLDEGLRALKDSLEDQVQQQQHDSERPAAREPLNWDRVLEIQMDEFETYETRRNTRPLTVAVLIEAHSRFQIAIAPAPIRPGGTMTVKRLAAIADDARRFGPRRNRSRAVCKGVFQRAASLRPGARIVRLATDQKLTYPGLAQQAFEGRQLHHSRTPSIDPRGAGTPLFPINHTEAIIRDHTGRMRRESWLVSKKRRYLRLHLAMYGAYRNWVRPRFNHDTWTPAMVAGFAKRPLTLGEFNGWRQDWGPLSPCPFAGPGRTVGAAGAVD